MAGYEVILSDIATVQVGYQARGKIEESFDGDFAIVRSQDFDDYSNLVPDQVMRFIPTINIDPNNYLISLGDILVQARGQNHKAYLINESFKNTVASNSFYVVRIQANATVLPTYLAWWINQTRVQSYFEQEQGLSTIPFISKKGLSKAPVVIPSLIVQEKISDLVVLWNQEQRLLQKLINRKETLIHAVAHKAIERSMEEK